MITEKQPRIDVLPKQRTTNTSIQHKMITALKRAWRGVKEFQSNSIQDIKGTARLTEKALFCAG